VESRLPSRRPILRRVLDVALRAIALVSCAIIALSFVLFATEQAGDASQGQVSAVVDPGGATERQRESHHTKPRETIDDVNDVLLRPFAAPLSSNTVWVKRGVPTLLGLLVYGLLLLYLARIIGVRSQPLVHHHRERPAATPASSSSTPPPPGV
jgi:hypothetical protein